MTKQKEEWASEEEVAKKVHRSKKTVQRWAREKWVAARQVAPRQREIRLVDGALVWLSR